MQGSSLQDYAGEWNHDNFELSGLPAWCSSESGTATMIPRSEKKHNRASNHGGSCTDCLRDGYSANHNLYGHRLRDGN
eukprot:5631346-Alexandrium_andersonii.AAC.1